MKARQEAGNREARRTELYAARTESQSGPPHIEGDSYAPNGFHSPTAHVEANGPPPPATSGSAPLATSGSASLATSGSASFTAAPKSQAASEELLGVRAAAAHAVDGEETADTDESLLARLRNGDEPALGKLWSRYAALLYTQALGVLHNPTEAEDVVAEVFSEVWRRAAGYHPERARPVAWLVTLVRRRSIDRLRERRSYEKAGERLAVESDGCRLYANSNGEDNYGDGVEEQVHLSEVRALLEQALEYLPERQRETVCMVYFHGLTQKEIATRTSTPLGTVKTRLELGLRKMRERIRGARLRSAAQDRGP